MLREKSILYFGIVVILLLIMLSFAGSSDVIISKFLKKDETSITILNAQSYPAVGGNWTVRFNTSGVGNLTITAVNGTSYTEIYDNSSTEDDLEFLEVKCGDGLVNASVVLEDGTIVPYDVYRKVKKVREIDGVLE